MEALNDSSHAGIDSFIHARQAKFTMNLSPVTALLAFLDWSINLADSPGTQFRIMEDFIEKATNYGGYAFRTFLNTEGKPEKSLAVDSRFQAEAWQQQPHRFI